MMLNDLLCNTFDKLLILLVFISMTARLTKGFYPHRLRKFGDSSVYVFQLQPAYPEQCADLCRVETTFCAGFDYFRDIKTCFFSTVSMLDSPLVPSSESEGADHYELGRYMAFLMNV